MAGLNDIAVFTCAGVALLILLRLSLEKPDELDGRERAEQVPARELMGRLLADDDLEYARKLGSPSLVRSIVRERRRLAMAWIHSFRRHTVGVFRNHFRRARYSPSVRPESEMALMAKFVLFLCVFEVLQLMLLLLGPFRTVHLFAWVRSLSELLAGLGDAIAGSALPSALEMQRGH